MSEAAEVATEIVAEIAEDVADGATQVAVATRGLSSRELSLVLGSVAVGTGLGVVVGFIFTRRRLETKYNQIASEEIAEMRQTYHDKKLALEATAQKTDLESLVTERGYATAQKPPLAIEPSEAVVEAARKFQEETSDEVVDAEVVEEVEIEEPPNVSNIFTNSWDYTQERRRRSPLRPYVIHVDERHESETYDDTTYTYYEADDVLCNESDEALSAEDRERLIGETNLNKFGHGSGDPSVVYIRNDQLTMVFEVIKSPNSYAEEVHGLTHDYGSENLERMRSRERQQFSDD